MIRQIPEKNHPNFFTKMINLGHFEQPKLIWIWIQNSTKYMENSQSFRLRSSFSVGVTQGTWSTSTWRMKKFNVFFGRNLPERFAIMAIWVFPNIWVFPPPIIHLFIGFGFPSFSPSILGVYPYFWKHPYYRYMIIYNSDHNSSLKIQTPMCCPCVSADKSMVLLIKRFTSPGQWTYHPCIQTCVCVTCFIPDSTEEWTWRSYPPWN